MKKNNTLYSYIAMTLWWLWSPNCAMAQGQDKDTHQWNGNPISSVLSATDNDMKTAFLYNVGTGKFLNVGSYWGTSVCAYDVGMYINFSSSNNSNYPYRMQGELKTPEGDYLAFGRHMDTSDSNPVSWNRVYCDRGTYYNGHINGIIDWKFEETSTGSKTYKISCLNNENEGMYGTRYLRVNPTPVNGSDRLDLVYPSSVSDANGWWKIVTLKDLKDAFKEAYASDEKPADATFLIQDQNFNRSNKDVGKWVASGFQYSIDNRFRFDVGNPYTYYVGMGCQSSDGYQTEFGRYWIGSVRNIGNNNANANGTLTQTVTALKKGWYRVSCDGFYSAASNNYGQTSTIKSSLFANVQEATDGISKVTIELNKFNKEFSYTRQQLTQVYTKNDLPTQSPYVKAAKLFEQGKYKNSILVYVPEAGAKLNIGIKVEGSTRDGDWTAFDNFQLQYCGDRDLILDEMQTSTYYMEQQADAQKAYTLILKRTLTADQWNSLALPVSLTAEQFKAAFGNEAKLSKLHGQDPNMPYRILFTSVNLTDDDAVAMEAGKLYIMKPTQVANVTTGSYSKRLKDETTVITVQAPYFVINNVTLAAAPEAIVKETSTISTTHDQKLQFCSSMIKQESNVVPACSYVLGSDGNWYFTQSDMPIKGFRCWIATGDAAAAKNFVFAIDDIDFETITAVNGIEADNSLKEAGTVYNLNGQVVARNVTSFEGLPSGVYIYNHRKVIIK